MPHVRSIIPSADGTYLMGGHRWRTVNGFAQRLPDSDQPNPDGPVNQTKSKKPKNARLLPVLETADGTPVAPAQQKVLRIFGKVVSKLRARIGQGWSFTPKRARDYSRLIQKVAHEQNLQPVSGNIELEIHIYLRLPTSLRPKQRQERLRRGHLQIPDIDNIEKMVLDALNRIAWHDDSQINATRKTKQWTENQEHLLVIIRPSLSHPGPAPIDFPEKENSIPKKSLLARS